jgi:ribonuclease HI
MDLYTDGAADSEMCGCGAILINQADKTVVWTLSEYLGKGTTTFGEFTAIKKGVQRAKELKATQVIVHPDSDICIQMFEGTKTTKKESIRSLIEEIRAIKDISVTMNGSHTDKKFHTKADVLANAAIISTTVTFPIATPSEPPRAVKPTMPDRDPVADSDKLWLTCPFSQKDTIKSLGARWSPDEKKWYTNDTPDSRKKFAQWLT